MTFAYTIEINGKIKSSELYEEIKKFKANVTDIIFLTYVYGEANLQDLVKIIVVCLEYGKIKVKYTRRQK